MKGACVALTALTLILASSTSAQEQGPDRAPADSGLATGLIEEEGVSYVEFTFPGPVKITDLVEYISRRTGTEFVYDERLQGTVVLTSPARVRTDLLLPLLESILKFKGFSLSRKHEWFEITPQSELVRRAEELIVLPDLGKLPADDRPVTVFIQLQHSDVGKVHTAIKPMLTPQGGNAVELSEMNALLLTDYALNLRQALRIVELLDRERPGVEMAVVELVHVPAQSLSETLKKLETAQEAARKATGGLAVVPPTYFLPDERTNRLVLLAEPEKLERLRALAKDFDRETNRILTEYLLEHIGPQDALTGVKNLLSGTGAEASVTYVPLARSNSLVVVGDRTVHDFVKNALVLLDTPPQLSEEVRFYPLSYTAATRTLDLLRQILADTPFAEDLLLIPDDYGNRLIGRCGPEEHEVISGLLSKIDQPAQEAAVGRATIRFFQLKNTNAEEVAATLRTIVGEGYDLTPEVGQEGAALSVSPGISPNPTARPPTEPPTPEERSGPPAPPRQAPPQGAEGVPFAPRILADRNTNTVIVNALYEDQQALSKLITALDRRRPQVLIEVTLIRVDADDTFTLGVELESNELDRMPQVLTFTSFGLSTPIDPATGLRQVAPAVGFNASVVTSNDLSVIVQALTTRANGRIVAVPKLLVNDNTPATIQSVAEEPFTSVNTGTTITTTSFAGYAEAGTTLTIVPRISEGDYVRLDYEVTLRSFTGTGQAGIPPARSSDILKSGVTIPNQHVLIVGGLVSQQDAETVDKVPILGDIPLLGYLFSLRSQAKRRSTLYAFIKPTILRDEGFEDLKAISRQYIAKSGKDAEGEDVIYPETLPERMGPPASVGDRQ